MTPKPFNKDEYEEVKVEYPKQLALQQAKDLAVGLLHPDSVVKKVGLFGSCVSPEKKEVHDIDMVVFVPEHISWQFYADYFKLGVPTDFFEDNQATMYLRDGTRQLIRDFAIAYFNVSDTTRIPVHLFVLPEGVMRADKENLLGTDDPEFELFDQIVNTGLLYQDTGDAIILTKPISTVIL